MSTAREEILHRIRTSLGDVPDSEIPAAVPVARDYRRHAETSRAEILEQLVDRLVDYKAKVRRVSAGELPGAIASACAARGVQRLAVPADLPEAWAPSGIEIARDNGLTHDQLDAVDGVLTGCALAIAQTGTIILDGGAVQGRRALTLLPDYHLCVVRAEQVVGLVPEAVSRLEGTSVRPLTWISGPSATSDIELNRVEGVHGPRTLEVLVVDEP
jgi:L-lactate dehydrogenase complex protein LldG